MAWSPPAGYQNRPVVVLGGGVLGRRIAAVFVASGWHVRLRDPSEKSRNDAIEYIENNLAVYQALTLSKGKGKYEATDDFAAAVRDSWLVFEAVPEVVEIKLATFSEFERHAPKDCILGSNSSSYKTSDLLGTIKDDTKRRLLNTHYMMPPQALIVELMTDGYTYPELFPFLEKELRAVGLHPYTALVESSGFIFNRIWAAIKREVLSVLRERVATPETIDEIWREQYNAPIGPCTMMGVGLDTVAHIEEHYIQERGLPSTTLEWLKENYVQPGKLGNKSGKGGLYPLPKSGHGTSIFVLNMYAGEYPGELSQQQILTSGQILRINLDNKQTKAEAVVVGEHAPDGIDIFEGRMYWTTMGSPPQNDGAVYSSKLDGSDRGTIIEPGEVHTPKQLHIHTQGKKLYFCDREGLRIHRSNLDGSNHEIIVQTGDWKTEPEKKADPEYWPVGITISNKLGKIYWTQKGGAKGSKGRIFSANLELPHGSDASNRKDIETVADRLPEPIDLEFDDESGVLYWTDRGEIPFGNTLNKKTMIGDVPAREQALGREIIAQGFGEAIGLRLDKEKQHIYVADLSGRLWACGTVPGRKTLIYQAPGHVYTGLAFVKY